MKISWSFLISWFFAGNCLAASVVALEPSTRKILLNGDKDSISTMFVNFDDGTVGVKVVVKTRIGGSRTAQTSLFQLADGQLLRDDDKLYFVDDQQQQILVARHKWWYSPYWQPTGETSISATMHKDPAYETRKRQLVTPVLTVASPDETKRQGH